MTAMRRFLAAAGCRLMRSLYIVFLYLPVIFLPIFSVNSVRDAEIPALRLHPQMVPGPAAHPGAARRCLEQPGRRRIAAIALPPCLASAPPAPITRYRYPGRAPISGLIMAPLVLPEIIVAISCCW